MSITDLKEAMIASGIDNVPEDIQADGIIRYGRQIRFSREDVQKFIEGM